MNTVRRGADLRAAFAAKLMVFNAPRILTRAGFDAILDEIDPSIAVPVVTRLLDTMVGVGLLAKPRKGLYVNRMLGVPVTDGELVGYLRPRAVLSLHSALESIAHNPADRIWCVVPTEWTDEGGVVHRPTTGTFSWRESNRVFEVRAIDLEAFEAPSRDDLFVTGVRGLSQATPEAALCHWLYLAKQTAIRNHGRGGTAWPDGRSADWRRLDQARLSRIADAMQVTPELDRFVSTIGDPLNGKHVDADEDDGPEMVF